MIKALIVEDDESGREQLKSLLDLYCRQVSVVGEADCAKEGAKLILELQPHLVFLDIQMPEQSGFDMLLSLGIYDFEVIFITGYDEYAIQAIRCSALDYILKPVNVAELVGAVFKAERKMKEQNTVRLIENLLHTVSHTDKLEHRIALPVSKGHRLINPYETIYTHSSNSYTTFLMNNGEEILVSKGLYRFEEILSGFGFIRCHASYMVNVLLISKFHKVIGGYEIILSNGKRLPVTTMYLPVVRQALKLREG